MYQITFVLLVLGGITLGQPEEAATVTSAPQAEATTAATLSKKAANLAQASGLTTPAKEPFGPPLLAISDTPVETVAPVTKAPILTRADLGLVVEKERYEVVVLSDPAVIEFVVDLTFPSEKELYDLLMKLRTNVDATFSGSFYTVYYATEPKYKACLDASRYVYNQTLNLQAVVAQARRFGKLDERLVAPVTPLCGSRTNQISVELQLVSVITLQENLLVDISNNEALLTEKDGTVKALESYVLSGMVGMACNVQVTTQTLLRELEEEITERLSMLAMLSSRKLSGAILYEVQIDCLPHAEREISEVLYCNGIGDGFSCGLIVYTRSPQFTVATILRVPIRAQGVTLQLTASLEDLVITTEKSEVVDVSDCTFAGHLITCPRGRNLRSHACLDACKKGTEKEVLEHCLLEVIPDDVPLVIQVANGTLVALRSMDPVRVTLGEHKIESFPVLIVHRQPLKIQLRTHSQQVEGNPAVLNEEVHALRLESEGLADFVVKLSGVMAWIQKNVPENLKPYFYGFLLAMGIVVLVLVTCMCSCLGYVFHCNPFCCCCNLSKCLRKSNKKAKQPSRHQNPTVRFKAVKYSPSSSEDKLDFPHLAVVPRTHSVESKLDVSSESRTDDDPDSIEMVDRSPARPCRRKY